MRATLVPSTLPRINSTRVFLRLTQVDARWNARGAPARIWIDAPTTGVVSKRMLTAPKSSNSFSSEAKQFEFEFDPGDSPTQQTLTGYAVYDVIENETGQPKQLRQAFSVVIPKRRGELAYLYSSDGIQR